MLFVSNNIVFTGNHSLAEQLLCKCLPSPMGFQRMHDIVQNLEDFVSLRWKSRQADYRAASVWKWDIVFAFDFLPKKK